MSLQQTDRRYLSLFTYLLPDSDNIRSYFPKKYLARTSELNLLSLLTVLTVHKTNHTVIMSRLDSFHIYFPIMNKSVEVDQQKQTKNFLVFPNECHIRYSHDLEKTSREDLNKICSFVWRHFTLTKGRFHTYNIFCNFILIMIRYLLA